MKSYLLLAISVLAMSSCVTRKYGCGLSKTQTQLNTTLVSGLPEREKKFVSISSTVNNVEKTHIYMQSIRHKYRGHGEVAILQDSIHPYLYLIHVDGCVIKDDTEITDAKYVVAYEGNFTDQLKYNIGKLVFFECKSVDNIYAPKEMLEIVDGCVEQVVDNFVKKDGTIVFHKM